MDSLKENKPTSPEPLIVKKNYRSPPLLRLSVLIREFILVQIFKEHTKNISLGKTISTFLLALV